MTDVPTGELVERLTTVAHRLRRASMKSLAPLGLTPAQSRALRIVARSAEGVRMGELAAAQGIVPRSATSLIDALEDVGLVIRTTDPKNRRTVVVTLTDRGRAVQLQMAAAREEAGELLFSGLTADQRRQLSALLATVVEVDG